MAYYYDERWWLESFEPVFGPVRTVTSPTKTGPFCYLADSLELDEVWNELMGDVNFWSDKIMILPSGKNTFQIPKKTSLNRVEDETDSKTLTMKGD
jgi:hypothetical protein